MLEIHLLFTCQRFWSVSPAYWKKNWKKAPRRHSCSSTTQTLKKKQKNFFGWKRAEKKAWIERTGRSSGTAPSPISLLIALYGDQLNRVSMCVCVCVSVVCVSCVLCVCVCSSCLRRAKLVPKKKIEKKKSTVGVSGSVFLAHTIIQWHTPSVTVISCQRLF